MLNTHGICEADTEADAEADARAEFEATACMEQARTEAFDAAQASLAAQQTNRSAAGAGASAGTTTKRYEIASTRIEQIASHTRASSPIFLAATPAMFLDDEQFYDFCSTDASFTRRVSDSLELH